MTELDELKLRLQTYLIELYKWKQKLPNTEKRIIVRHCDGKIEAIESVLEMIADIRNTKGE